MSKPSEKIFVVGAGGHAKAVVGAAQVMGFEVVAVYDDDASKWGKQLLGVPIVGPIKNICDEPPTPVLLAIGDAVTRKAMAEQLKLEWATLVHSSASIHSSVILGPGTVAFAGVVVQAGTYVGSHVILNANATVSNDCVLEDFVHLAPGVDLASGVRIEAGSFLGIGAVALPDVRVGAWTTVGAGAAIINDLPARVVAVGSPARPIKSVDGRAIPAVSDY